MGSSPPGWPTDLTGQVALVTGATAGLGAQFARTLHAAGARVAVAGRRTDRLKALVAELGEGALAVPLDMTDAGAITDAVDAVTAWGDIPSILVNNAGVPDARRAHRMDVELVDLVIATNVRGPFLLSIEVARRLIAAERPGRIVNISSMSAFHYAGEGAALYATTKAALNRMTETLAVEWADRGINVNAIAPGAFATEMMDGMIERTGGDPSPTFPRGRLGLPSQLDTTLLYLVAPASGAVTGTVVKVDDGQYHR